jgi:hypothetical protein
MFEVETLQQYHLSMKKDGLFVLLVSHVEISQTTTPLAILLVPLESPQ